MGFLLQPDAIMEKECESSHERLKIYSEEIFKGSPTLQAIWVIMSKIQIQHAIQYFPDMILGIRDVLQL